MFQNNSVFRASLLESDAIIKRELDHSLIHELYEKTDADFDDLLMTHPAIVAIEIAMGDFLHAKNVVPDYAFGTSLGELASLVTCDVLSKEEAIQLSIEQAKSIKRSNIEGGMIAVLSENTEVIKDKYLDANLYLASDNFEGHFTLSGSQGNLKIFEDVLSELGITFFRLPVNIPFHSPLIQMAFNDFNYHSPVINYEVKGSCKLLSSIENKVIHNVDENYFWNVTEKYSNFEKSIQFIESKGRSIYIDLGPSGSCATFTKYILGSESKSKVFSTLSPFKGVDQRLNQILELFEGF